MAAMIDAEAAARDLATGHAATREAVSACLDVESGLREVLLTSEHEAMQGDVTAELQVESGLGAIVSSEASPMTGPTATIRGDSPVAEVVQELPAAQRLELRKHQSLHSFGTAVSSLSTRALAANLGNLEILPYIRDIERVLTLARERAWRGDLDRGADLNQALTYARALSHALGRILQQARDFAAGLPDGKDRPFAQRIALEVDSARERTVIFVRKLTLARDAALGITVPSASEELFGELLELARDCDPVRARVLAEGLNQNLTSAIDQALFGNPEGRDEKAPRSSDEKDPSRKLTVALRRTPVTDRAHALVWLRDALDNFQGADLRNADLTGVPLDGLRWSASTQWPDKWADGIWKHSVPLPGEEGVFVVRGYGSVGSVTA
jgi:hypothetical protein